MNNGKSKTPITAARSKKNNGEAGGTQARASQQKSKNKNNGVKQAVLERISDGILAFDAGMNYTYLNERAGELLGRSAGDLVGKNLREEFSGTGPTPFMEACQRALETRSVVWLNEYFPPTDRWLEGRVYPSQDGVSVVFTEGMDRKQMEEFLGESERKFNLIFNKLPFTALLLRPEDNVIVDINEEFEAVFGYTRQESVGKTTFELGIDSKPEDRAYILAELQANVAIRDMEIQFHTKSHGPRTFLINTDMVNIGGNGYVLQTAQDITERKQIEQSLAHEREMFKRLFETMPVMSTIYEPETGTMRMNAEIERVTGWRVEEVTVVSLLQALYPDPDYMKDVLGRMAAAVTTKEWVEAKICTRDGRTLDTLWANISLMDGEKIITGISLGIDITERKRAEEALRASEEKYRRIVETANEGIWEINREGQTVFVNARMAEMLGYSLEEMIGRSAFEFVFPEDYVDGEQRLARAKRDSIAHSDEFRYRRKDGSSVWTLTSISPQLDEQGNFNGSIAMIMDITERKQAEKELSEFARQQEALYRLADELSSAGSLEEMFNPTLNAIQSALQCDRASILLFDNQDVMRFVAWRGLSDAYRRATDGHSPWTRAEKNARPISMDDVSTGDLGDSLRAAIQAEGIGALAFIPLINRGQLIGKFMVYFNTPHVFEEAKIDLAQTIAHQLASHIERKQAEETLRQSEERFARFMLHLPGLAWIKDMQGRYVFANTAARKAFNASQEELYGKTDAEIFPREVAAQFNRNDDLAIAEERGVQVVETLPQVDGVVHHSLVTKFPIPGPDGRPFLIGGTAFDITERVQMEQALQEARRHAEIVAGRMTRLQRVTAALSQALTPPEIARMVVEQGAPALGAVAASVLLFDEETQTVEIIHSSSPEAVTRPFARFPLSLDTPASQAIRSSQLIWIESQDEYLERYPHLAESIHQWGYQAAMAIPMLYQGRILGVLTMSFSQPLSPSSEDKDYLLTLARQAALAMERSRVEATLRLDAAMLENVSAGIYLVSASDGTIIHTNPKLDAIFGYEPGEVVGRQVAILNASTQNTPEQTANSISDMLRKDGTWQGEVLSQRKDGTAFWCSATVSTFEHDRFGKVWVASRQDITERKQVENALRESEDRYRAIISQTTAGIVRKDPFGRLLYVNQAFCNMLGYIDTELLGRPIWDLTHEQDTEENKRLYNRLMAEGIPFQLEKRLIHRNGSILWVTVSVSPVVDITGRPHSAVSVYVDITGRKQAENRLALLSSVSELAREFEDPDELMFAVSSIVGEHFQARRALFNEIDLENDREIVHHDYCHGVESVAGVHTISEYSSITTAEMMAGRTVVNRDSKLDPRTAADYEKSYVKNGERSYVAIPLMHEERWVASLWISNDKPRQWTRNEVSLLETVAERTWIAIEKMRVDRALRDSEERLRVTLNTTVVGFATLTPETYFVDVNDAFCRIVGYSRQELLKMNFDLLTHPNFIEETRKHVAQLLASEVPFFTLEKIYVRGDGTEIWVQNSVSIVRDENGNPLHLITICQDITERKRAEEALHQLNLELEERVKRRTIELQAANEFLRESEATSRLILESMPDAIVIIDKEGQIVHANTQVESLFGYSPVEVMGQSVETLVPQRFRPQHEQQRFSYGEQRNRRIMGLGQEFLGRRKDDSEFPVEVMLAPIDNSTNWDVLVAIRDNTRQRQAQEALRTNEEKLRTLFEILPVGISFLDKEGNVSELNTALTEILDLPRSQILAGNYKSRRFIRADGTPMPSSDLASVRARQEHKTIYNVETGIVKENGEIIWTSVNAAPVQVADVEAAIVTIDITERKKAEEALHQNRERLRVLSRRLVEVQEEERHAIARELHDRVGQNLAALTLNLNILRNQLSDEILEKVGTRLNDSVTLVKDILTITRSVMADLRPNVLDDYGLDAAINEYADRFTQRYGIRVIRHTPATPSPRLDPGVEMTLLRIAQEALTNIAKHSQATQTVMTLEMENDAVLLTIEDNGQGILSWQKVNQPGSHGLRIMRERAEAFGGSLKVHSTYKNGTTIEVKIPLASSLTGKGRKEKKS